MSRLGLYVVVGVVVAAGYKEYLLGQAQGIARVAHLRRRGSTRGGGSCCIRTLRRQLVLIGELLELCSHGIRQVQDIGATHLQNLLLGQLPLPH